MTVVATLPAYIAGIIDSYELIVERTTPQCGNIKCYTPAVLYTLLHWQSTGRVPCTKHIGITCEVKALASAQTSCIDRECDTTVIPIDGWLVEFCHCLVEKTEEVCLSIATGRRIEPHVVHNIIAVHAIETECVRCSRPLGAQTIAIKTQFIAIIYIGITVINLQ